jgi:hypothetical protein
MKERQKEEKKEREKIDQSLNINMLNKYVKFSKEQFGSLEEFET